MVVRQHTDTARSHRGGLPFSLPRLSILPGCSSVGRVRGLGPRCRRFESYHSDQAPLLKGAYLFATVAELADAKDGRLIVKVGNSVDDKSSDCRFDPGTTHH